uniref:hypothetical protein n=1 Tax=Candidatus Enterococcus willemsii TaxID=1857215 RepID=UPI00403F9938
MKKVTIFHSLIALLLIFLVWVPPTRIFLTDIPYCNVIVFLLSCFLCISAAWTYQKSKQKRNVLFFIVGLSPLFFILLLFLLALRGMPLAP